MWPRHRRALARAALLTILGGCGVAGAEATGQAASSGTAPPHPAAVAAAAVTLVSAEPGTSDSPASDLAALSRWLGEARLVGLGEGEHGTQTLHRLTHRVFAHLAREAGFDVLALEIDGAHAALLDAWVQGERDDLEAILAERWWGSEVFYDEATLELLRWMRAENRSGRRRLRVAGFDLKQPALAARMVVDALRPIDEVAAAAAEARFRRALAPGAFGLFPNVWGFTGSVRVPLPRRPAGAPALVELEVRADGVTYGTAGVAAAAGDAQQHATRGPENLTADWRPLRLELEVPALVEELELTLYHRGDGTVWLTAPRITVGGTVVVADLGRLQVRPLLMPRLQANDYRHEVVPSGALGRPALRIEADPGLRDSRAAAAAAEAHVRGVVERAGGHLESGRAAWLVQAARLVRQAVEWRTLGQNNRDVFLAENLAWLATTAFPERRILALAHRSHAERREGRMGAWLDQRLGASYRTVSMLVGSGEELAFGELATLEPGAALVTVPIEPPAAGTFEGTVAALREGEFLLPLAEIAGTPAGRSWLEAVHPRPREAPDVVIWLDRAAPMRQAVPR